MSLRVPYVPIRVFVAGVAQALDSEALVDTGFSGYVIVPIGTFSRHLRPRFSHDLQLADGSAHTAPAYRGDVTIGPITIRRVLITELGNEGIIGLRILRSFNLTIDHAQLLALDP